MAPNLDQSKTIENINRYLEWHNLPMRFEREGMCNGLASVYAKYVLEGKEDTFFKILSYIATMSTAPEWNDKINHFVGEVLLCAEPKLFDSDKSQMESIHNLQIEGKNLSPSFSLGLITSRTNWQILFNDIELTENEVILIRTPNHVVSVRKFQGKYHLYDPNYDFGFKTLENEKKLVDELCNISKKTGIKGHDLGLTLQVISHPNNTPREFPNQTKMYKNYFDKSNFVTVEDELNYTSLMFALNTGDESVLDELLEQDVKDNTVISFLQSYAYFKPRSFDKLISKITKDDTMQIVFSSVLLNGKKQMFEALLRNKTCLNFFNKNISFMGKHYIFLAAQGGNVDLLKHVFSEYWAKRGSRIGELFQIEMNDTYEENKDLILAAIKSTKNYTGGVACVQWLLRTLNQKGYHLNDKQYKKYLDEAITLNHPEAVAFVVNEIKNNLPEATQKNIFQSISMERKTAKDTDLAILRTLKEEKVPFSKLAQGILDTKEKRPIGIISAMGITLMKFTDFVQLQYTQVTKYASQLFFSQPKLPSSDLPPSSEKKPKI